METATLKSVVRMKTRIAAYDAGFFDDRMGRLANNEMPSAMMLVGSTGVGRSTLAEKIRSNALHGVRCSASDLISRFKLRRVVQADCVVLEDPEVQGFAIERRWRRWSRVCFLGMSSRSMFRTRIP